jgi:hypothetical protein
MTQNNLGIVLQLLGERRGDEEILERGRQLVAEVQAFREASQSDD